MKFLFPRYIMNMGNVFAEIFVINFIVIIFLNSCASNNKYVYGMSLTAKEQETVEIIGPVEAEFETTISWNKNKTILDRSYYELLKTARNKYGWNEKIDVKNIVIERQQSSKNYILLGAMFLEMYARGGAVFGNPAYTNIHAKGDVIKSP